VAIVKDDFRIYDDARGQLNGLAVAWGEFGFPFGSQSTAFTLTGRAIVNKFYVGPRSEWYRSNDWWKDRLHDFLDQLTSSNPIFFFPLWLQTNYGLKAQPQIVLRPPQSGETFHWHNWSQPVYVAHPSDGGLRWEVVQVRELR
jgi:hypothetical protein